MRHIDDEERRARIAARHGIAPSRRRATPEEAAAAMTVLHATDLSTVYLSLLARVDRLDEADVDAALNMDRTLARQVAMRRTLFVVPRDLLPAVLGSASARVAGAEGRRLIRDVKAAGIAVDGDEWLQQQAAAVSEVLASTEPMTTRALRARVPEIGRMITVTGGPRWSGEVSIAPRLLTYLFARGLIARGPNDGHWRAPRPTWTVPQTWFGDAPELLPSDDGYAALVRRWLWTFGPGTERDIAWWLGAPLGIVRRALHAVGAAAVSLDNGSTGFVLSDDLEPVQAAEPWAALLPILDPTTMGWKERDFYLGAHGPQVFDSAGNGGTTAWWNGRIVGVWIQTAEGDIRVAMLEDVPPNARAALDAEAERLARWLGGVRIATAYMATAMRVATAGADASA